eukprot:TRINITY_DN1949_c0_g4_i1.p1 TRINITY_DN1949_c0_g4~~TRINITY_DN1949_c0_g4_i1.p1  ORF type:complete len:134 (+),score=41.67 TRINITY_DN1949_c0_g4_i1:150-551(+)
MSPTCDTNQIAQQDKSTASRLPIIKLRDAEDLPELEDCGSDFLQQPSLFFRLGSPVNFCTELAARRKEIREDIIRVPAKPEKDTGDALKAILQDALKRRADTNEQQAEDAEHTKVAAQVSQHVVSLTEALSKL